MSGVGAGAADATTRWAVVLAGGVGSRFWPLSTPQRPKQLLPLVNERSLLENTLHRLGALAPAERTLVLTNGSLVDAIRTICPDLPPENVIAEPRSAGTAAALAWAALEIARRGGPDDAMVCVHADWSISDDAGFVATVAAAARAAVEHHSLVTVGVVPTRPDPGFGYIEPGPAVAAGVFRVARFFEKPSRERAEQMVASGYLWNSGIFAWRVADFLAEVRALTPEIAPALDARDITSFFAEARSISVDVGVLERSTRVLVLPGEFGWDDVGTWAALGRVRDTDGHGNVVRGDVHALDSRANVVHAEGNAVVLYGVSGLVVVTRDGLTLVTSVDRSVDLKTLIDSLPDAMREPAR